MPIRQVIANVVSALSQSESIGALLTRLGILRGTGEGTESVTFTVALIALAAKLAKSDGVVKGVEFEAFRRTIVIPPEEEANVRRLFDLAKRDVAGFETYARQIALALKDNPALRRNVMEGLFFVAAADGILHEKEDSYLKTVSDLLGLPPSEFGYVRSLFVRDGLTPYEILGVTPAATPAEIKARYRELVRENHPDQLVGRGLAPDFIAAASERLAAVNAAYDVISKERGIT